MPWFYSLLNKGRDSIGPEEITVLAIVDNPTRTLRLTAGLTLVLETRRPGVLLRLSFDAIAQQVAIIRVEYFRLRFGTGILPIVIGIARILCLRVVRHFVQSTRSDHPSQNNIAMTKLHSNNGRAIHARKHDCYDAHATMLHLLRIDCLTDVYGQVVAELLKS